MDIVEQQIGRKDQRGAERRHIVYYLRVYDGSSHSIFGHLVDISERGIMLLCENPVEVNKTFDLCLSLANLMKGHEKIVFPATSKWCKSDADPDFYLAGFQFEDPEPPFKHLVTTLMRDFSQNELVKT